MSHSIDQAAWERHESKTQAVSAAVTQRPEGTKVSIRKNTPHHQIHARDWKSSTHRVDVSNLDNILGYEEARHVDGYNVVVAVCEGQVTMGQLARKAFADLGMIPQVVPEYDNFTCAGLINGEGIQTSAHRYGVFTNTVTKMEVVLGNGEVRTCTRALNDPNRDLFLALCESYGSMAIVTLVCVALREAKPFVRSTFTHYRSPKEFSQRLMLDTKNAVGDFLEGLVLAKDSYVIIRSEFTERAEKDDFVFNCGPEPENDGEVWYYQHIRDRVIQNKRVAVESDCIPTLQFLFRSMRGAWWMVECHVGLKPLTDLRFIRAKADKACRETLDKSGGFGAQSNDELRCVILQDMGMRLSRLEEAIEFVNGKLGVYPLWICPVHQRRFNSLPKGKGIEVDKENIPLDPDWQYICDVGVYGEPTVKPFYHRRAVKSLIDFVDMPSKWGTSYLSKDEIRNEKLAQRRKFHAVDAFVGIEDKVSLRSATDDANSDEREIFAWRLKRDYGKYWLVVVIMFFTIVFGVAAGLIGAVFQISS